MILFDIFHFRGITRLGIGLFVGIADGDDVIQLVVGRDVETVEEELALLIRQQEAYGTAQTAGAKSH